MCGARLDFEVSHFAWLCLQLSVASVVSQAPGKEVKVGVPIATEQGVETYK